MQTINIQNQVYSRPKFLWFVINFYRILGITFGGISLDKNGNLIKSTFWYHFGWLSFIFYASTIIFFITELFFDYALDSNKPIMYWISSILWDIITASMNC